MKHATQSLFKSLKVTWMFADEYEVADTINYRTSSTTASSLLVDWYQISKVKS